ncbi:unnamed protein product, partial [Effrenium voratum]
MWRQNAASAGNAASARNVASGNVASECGVSRECGGMWRRNAAAAKNAASGRNVASEECGVTQECGVRGENLAPENVASECGVSRECGVREVFWHDGEAWRAARDACPHRGVRLSEGRLNERSLQCPYHGWAFDGAGRCVSIPQAEKEKASSARKGACLRMLPTEERQGLLFAWAAPLYGDAAPPDLGLLEELAHEERYVDYSRDLPMDLPILMENVLDPAHLPFTHHGTISQRERASSVPIQTTASFNGFTGERSTSPGGGLAFFAPNHVWALTQRPESFRDWNLVYGTPLAEDSCRVFVRVVFE